MYCTNTNRRVFASSAISKLDKVYIMNETGEYPAVEVKELYSAADAPDGSFGFKKIRIELKPEEDGTYNLRELFSGCYFGGMSEMTILPNPSGKKYVVSDLYEAFYCGANTSNTVTNHEIKGLNNLDTSRITKTNGFYRCFMTLVNFVEEIDISGWELNSSAAQMFRGSSTSGALTKVCLGRHNYTFNPFYGWGGITDITVESISADFNMGNYLLTKESVVNIVNALNEKGSGTISVSDVSKGYFTDTEWQDLENRVPSGWNIRVNNTSVAQANLMMDSGD